MARPDRFAPGHRLCAGCGAGIAARAVLRALEPEDRTVVCSATGCLEASSFSYPYTAWRDSFIHSAFENAAATMSGIECAYEVLKKKGTVRGNYRFVTFGGDGGTYDIGLQSLSGAMERGHDMVYVCYDNEAYMNTGTQRSSGTPQYADTTTSPAGLASDGKPQFRKDLTAIMAAHKIPYLAQTTFTANFKDLHEKAEKALYTRGPAFINILSPCPRGWRYETRDLMKLCRLAADTCFWPLYEIENGKWRLTYEPKKKLPIEEFLKIQGRFSHLFRPEHSPLLEKIQEYVDRQWEELKKLATGA
jgi:pyruvate ferredoxin oxidoreductase beta subunit